MPTPSVSWSAVETALQAWVAYATGYDNAHVYWAHPNVHRPANNGTPFCTLEILDRTPITVAPEIVQIDHVSPSGSEVELAATQTLDCGFRVQVFTPPLRGTQPGTPRGAGNAAAIAEQIRLCAALSSVMALLDVANISVHDMGHVTYVPEIVGTDFEGRAVLDCRFYVGNSVSDFTGYIATIQIADQIPTENTTVTVTLPVEP